MATSQSSSTSDFPQGNLLQPLDTSADRDSSRRQLAVRLADAIVSRSYAPSIWAMYYRRFLGVLSSENPSPLGFSDSPTSTPNQHQL